MSDEANANVNTNPTTPAGGQPPAPDSAELSLQDLVAVKSIIDVASSRGAFKPNEMIAVGSVSDCDIVKLIVVPSPGPNVSTTS